ncbi:MAG TPA: hypothetical protein VJV78_05020 [Polyangiales bacterium]|nr:hypothetical protein [Polyangiales bacterium]
MAQRHGFQDTADLSGPKALSDFETPHALVLGLGVNVWITHVLLALVSDLTTLSQYAVGVFALLCLLLGVAARMSAALGTSERREAAARWLLLGVYPGAIGLSLSLGDERVRETAHSAISMPLCAAALLAYGAAAVSACRKRPSLLEAEIHALNGREAQLRPKRLRRFVIGAVLLGSLAICVVAPLWPPYPQAAEAWGEAAEAGAVLTALVAMATAVSVIVVHLGSALRRSETRGETVRQRRNRFATLLFLTLLGFVTYWIVVP